MSGHTPGPWYWQPDEQLGWVLSPGVMIVDCYVDGTPGGDRIDRANARLIAAAPALLVVAEFVVEHASKAYPPELVMQAEAAVAQARGREGADG